MENIYSGWPFLIPYIHSASMMMDAIRWAGWGILCGLGIVVSAVYEAYMNLFTIDLGSIPVVGEWLTSAGTLWPSILTTFLILAGMYIIFGNKKVQKELASGLLLAIILLVITPLIFSTMGNLVSTAIPALDEQFTSSDGQQSKEISNLIIKTYTVDILSSAENGNLEKLETKPINLLINTKIGGYFGNEDLFNYKITSISDSGVASGTALTSDAWFMEESLNEGLYRYDFKFLEPFLILILLLLGIVFAAMRTAKIMFELVFNQTIAPFVFASDPYNAGRTKEFIRKIISTYIVLIVIFFLLLLFMSLSMWILNTDHVANVFTQIFLIAGCAWGMIDGPDMVVKLLGIDAGVRSASAPLIATGMALGSAGRLAAGATRLGKSAASNTASVLGSSAKDGTEMTRKSFGESGWGFSKTTNSAPLGASPSDPDHLSEALGVRTSQGSMASSYAPSQEQSTDTSGSFLPEQQTREAEYSAVSQDSVERRNVPPQTSAPESSSLPESNAPKSDPKRSAVRSPHPPRRSSYRPAFPPAYQPPNLSADSEDVVSADEEPARNGTGASGYMAPPDLNQIDQLLKQRQIPDPRPVSDSIPHPLIEPRQERRDITQDDRKKYQDRRSE